MTKNKNVFLSAVSLFVLMAVAALSVISCGKEEKKEDTGKGIKVTVTVEVTDKEGEKTKFVYETEKSTLREVLEENSLVKGDESEFGLYIKEVNGIRADYELDGAYWAMYKNGEYLTSSADDEELTDGAVYGLVYTEG